MYESCPVQGAESLVVLLHPAGYDSRYWDKAAELLADRLDVLAPDRPAHGRHIDELGWRRAQADTAAEYRQLLSDMRGERDEAHQLATLIAEHRDRGPGRPAVPDADPDGPGTALVGVGDAGLLALKAAATDRLDVQALVLVDTTVLAPEELSLDDIMSRLEDSELDHRGLADVMAQVLARKDAEPYADWVMAQPVMLELSNADRALVRDMVTTNTLPALFAPSYSPGDVSPEELAALTGPILQLRAGSTPASDLPLDGLLTGTHLTRERIPHSPPLFALSAPEAFADRVARFVHEHGRATGTPPPVRRG